jgi:helicase-exonuclease AddAB, AddB subunit
MKHLTALLGRSGAGKTEYCLTQIGEHLKNDPNEAPLILIVPEQATFQMEKALAARLPGQGFLGAQIFGFRRFSHRILQETGGLWLPSLSDSGRQLILGKILRDHKDELLALGKAALRPHFADTLSELIQEFRTHRISPEELKTAAESEALANSPLKNKLLDLSLLYQAFLDFLENRYRDTSEALDHTVAAIAECGWLSHAKIWVDGFDRFSPQEWEILAALLEKTDQVTVALCLDDPNTALADTHLFHRPAQTLQRLKQIARDRQATYEEISLDLFRRSTQSDLIHLEKHLYGATQPFTDEDSHIHLIAAPNPRQEIVAIARSMMNQVRFGNYRWRDLALLLRQSDPYRTLAESVFTEYKIPFYRDQNITPTHHPLVELICSVFEIFSSRWLPEPIFRAAKTGLLLSAPEELDQLENYVLEFGLKGSARWRQIGAWTYARRFALEEDTLPDEEEIARLDLIDRTRKNLAAPLLTLENAWQKATTVKEKSIAFYEFWETLAIDHQLEELALQAEREDDPETARLHRQMGSEIRSLLDELVELLGNETLSDDEYARLIQDGLEGLSIRLIPPGLDHVMIHSLQSVLPAGIRCAYLPGANDGLFPARAKPEGLLSEADRHLLSKTGLELAPSALADVYNERLIAYRGLTAPTDSLWLSYSLATQDGSGLTPSPLVARLQELFPLQIRTIRPEDDWATESPKNSLFRENLSFVALATALRRMRDQEPCLDYWKNIYNHFLAQPDWQHSMNDLTNSLLGQNKATHLPPLLAHSLYAPQGKLKGSVTRLEAFQACPFKHFAQYGLRLKERPEFQLAPPQVGVFLHGVLKKYGQTLLEENKKWHQLNSTEQEELIQAIIGELAGKLQNEILYSNAQYQYFLKRLSQTVERAIHHLTAFSALTAFEPLALEQTFGNQPDGWLPLTFPLGSNHFLEISGQIDRIDKAQTEDRTYLLIIDYKSGSRKLTLNDAYHGLSLQLLTYLLVALEGATALTGSSEPYSAGILYYFLQNPLLKADEPISPEEAHKQMESALRMPGWLLKDKEVLNLIETEFASTKSTRFAPYVKVGNKDEFYKTSLKNLKSDEDFTAILKHLKKVLTASGENILQGNIEIAPYQTKKTHSCKFCNYRSFCGFDRFQGNTYRFLEELEDNEIFKRLKKENSDHD